MRKIFKGFHFVGILVLLGIFAASCTGSRGPRGKVIKFSSQADAKGFDPAFCEDYYTHMMVGQIYEGLVEYEYLRRPFVLKPALAEALPEISKDGLTYTFKIKKGLRFADHSVFPEGKGRELKAKDFEYSLKRIIDPVLNSTGAWLFEGHVLGVQEWRTAQKALPATNYDLPWTGVAALDDYTLQIKLNHKYPQLLYALAMPAGWVVAREVVEKTGKDFVNTPVGTGPYKLVSWTRNSKAVFEKNPNFRVDNYPSEGEASDEARGFLKDKGRPMPFVDNVEVYVYQEEQPRWLNFVSGNTDVVRMPKDYFKVAIDPNTLGLKKDLLDQGIQLQKVPETEVTYIHFNLLDPIFKKYGAPLRKAISIAIDHEKDWEIFYNKSAIIAQSPIPPGLAGYDPNYVNLNKKFDLVKAKEIMKSLGFGPNKKLTLTYDTSTGTDGRQMGEKYQKELAEIYIDLKVNLNQFSELIQKQTTNKIQMAGIAWISDYPDVENFLQLLYGPNKSPLPNHANMENAEYDKLYVQVRGMADSPERRRLISQMVKIIEKEIPWIPGVHRITHWLNSKRLKNFKANYQGPHLSAKYLDIDEGSPSEKK